MYYNPVIPLAARADRVKLMSSTLLKKALLSVWNYVSYGDERFLCLIFKHVNLPENLRFKTICK